MAVFVAALVAIVGCLLLLWLVARGRRVPAALTLVVSALPWIAGSAAAHLRVMHVEPAVVGVRYDELAHVMARGFAEAMAVRALGAVLGAALLGAMTFGLLLAARAAARRDAKTEAVNARAVATILVLASLSAVVAAVAASFLEGSYAEIAEASATEMMETVLARSRSAPLAVAFASLTPAVASFGALTVVGIIVARFGPTPRRVLGGALAVVVVAGLGYLDGASGRAIVHLLDATRASSWVGRGDVRPIAFRGGPPNREPPSALVRADGVVELGGDGELLGAEVFTPVGRGQLVSLFRRLPEGSYSPYDRTGQVPGGRNLVLAFDARSPPEGIGSVIAAARAAGVCSLTIFGRHPDGISEEDVEHLLREAPYLALPVERAAVVTARLGDCREEAESEPARPLVYVDVDAGTAAALSDLRASSFAPFLGETTDGRSRFEGR
jgi:hypothetical protein